MQPRCPAVGAAAGAAVGAAAGTSVGAAAGASVAVGAGAQDVNTIASSTAIKLILKMRFMNILLLLCTWMVRAESIRILEEFYPLIHLLRLTKTSICI